MKKKGNDSKFSVIQIIRNHISNVTDIRKNWSTIDYVLFRLVAPLLALFALWLSFYKNHYDLALPLIRFETVGSLLTSLSIFVALLLNLLVLTYSITARFRFDVDVNIDTTEVDYIGHMHNNITAGILVALLGVTLLLVYDLELLAFSWILETILVYYIYLLILLFILIMLVILEAVHIVFVSIFNENKE